MGKGAAENGMEMVSLGLEIRQIYMGHLGLGLRDQR